MLILRHDGLGMQTSTASSPGPLAESRLSNVLVQDHSDCLGCGCFLARSMGLEFTEQVRSRSNEESRRSENMWYSAQLLLIGTGVVRFALQLSGINDITLSRCDF